MVFTSVDDMVFCVSLDFAFLFVKFYDLTCCFVTFYFQATTKEGYLLKQTWSFQRWRRRYFRLKGHRLYYAKDAKVRTIVAVFISHITIIIFFDDVMECSR